MNIKDKKMIYIGIIIMIIILLFLGIYIVMPKIKLKGNKVVDVIYPSKYEEKGYKVDSIIKNLNSKVVVKSNIDEKKVGTYKVEYTISWLIFKNKKYRTVNIIDNTQPEITLEGEISKTICPNSNYEEEGYKAFDNYDGDITINVKVQKADDEITYKVADSSNNETEIKRTIVKKDEESPIITINGSSTKSIIIGSNYIEEGSTATDNCDGDLTNKIETYGSVDTNNIGTYEIVYKVQDTSGNITEAKRVVNVINKTNYSNSTIYLTFDDGPSSNITPKILDILKEEGIKATFFVIDHGDTLDYIIKRAYDEGHTIALHTASHNYAKIYTSEDAFFTDLDIIRERVKKVTGQYSNIIRFPGGTSNTVSRSYNRGIMSRLSKEVLNRGYVYFDWNISSGDAGGVSSKWDVYNNVVNGLTNRATNVVLMHDSSQKTYTLEALRDIIHYGKEKGYSFDRISESTQPIRHNPAN